MKWIPKIVAGLIILAIFSSKVLTPNQTLLSEIVSDIVLVLFLLGLGEKLLKYGWVMFTQAISMYRIANVQKSILRDFVGLRKLILIGRPFFVKR